jgi:hypothetical protein
VIEGAALARITNVPVGELKHFADRHRLPTLVGVWLHRRDLNHGLAGTPPGPELDAELAAIEAELDNLDVDAVFREIEDA